MRTIWRRRLWLLLATTALLGGCRTAEFYERGRLARPSMQFDEDPGEVHFVQKSTYAREGSAGGVGTTVGGGCGCY